MNDSIRKAANHLAHAYEDGNIGETLSAYGKLAVAYNAAGNISVANTMFSNLNGIHEDPYRCDWD